jgi:hypothetical protein
MKVRRWKIEDKLTVLIIIALLVLGAAVAYTGVIH